MSNIISSTRDFFGRLLPFRSKDGGLISFGKTKKIEANDNERKPGIVSPEAVQWFLDRDMRTLAQARSFVPWIIQKGIRLDTVSDSTDTSVVFRGQGAVVFCDASGFTKLTETLAQKPNGAELLSRVLNQFYTPLVDLISQYRGDIIKFSGDALTILFQSEPDDRNSTEYDLPCGSGWARCPGHADLELAVLRATACCVEIHKRLDNFDTGIPDRTLSFHIGIGCGSCTVLHVGGMCSPDDSRTRRFEYVICGEPLEQIAHACHYAEVYETVLSPQAWELVKGTVTEGAVIPEDPSYHKLGGLDTTKHTYATIRAAAQARDTRESQYALKLHELPAARRYIPCAVYMQMENGTLDYVNEIRGVTVIFVCVGGVDVSTPKGATVAQDLMSSVQVACYEQEGSVNKFLVDDKGLLFLCVFGTPPMVHTDDPTRAVNASFGIIAALKRLGLVGNVGISTGRVFCGLVGSSARQEYTTLGDSVNLAARFMQLGKPNLVVVDESTFEQSKSDFDYQILDPVKLKGKSSIIPIFQPSVRTHVGSPGKAIVVRDGQTSTATTPRAGMLSYSYSLHDEENSPTKKEVSASPSLRLVAGAPQQGKRQLHAVGASQGQEDPLGACSYWKELKVTRRILEESRLLRGGGTIVFGGQSGLGKDQLCQIVVDISRQLNSTMKIVSASDNGQPRDRARPIIELIETCLTAAKECGLVADFDKKSKLEIISELSGISLPMITRAARLNEVSGLLEIPELNEFVSSAMNLDKVDAKKEESGEKQAGSSPTVPIVSIGNQALSPSRGAVGRNLPRASIFSNGMTRGESKLFDRSEYTPHEDQFIAICISLLQKLLAVKPLTVVMRNSRGTSLFNIVNNPTFWKLLEEVSGMNTIGNFSGESTFANPLVVVVLCRRTDDSQNIVAEDSHLVELEPLPRNCIEEYIGKILRLDTEGVNNIPQDLVDFVEDLTQGNPLYIMETLEQLIQRNYITRSVQGYVVVNVDLHEEVKVFEWSHTAMVGRVICQLEALAPQESAIVKMASVFHGPFSVLDVAASLKSPYTDAKRFDNYRMYRTCARLTRLGIISEIGHLAAQSSGDENGYVPINDMSRFPKDTNPHFVEAMNKIPMFILDNFLIRKVAAGMTLQQQALKVKRQALLHRVITTEVPERIEANRKRAAGLHMPYYNLVKL